MEGAKDQAVCMSSHRAGASAKNYGLGILQINYLQINVICNSNDANKVITSPEELLWRQFH